MPVKPVLPEPYLCARTVADELASAIIENYPTIWDRPCSESGLPKMITSDHCRAVTELAQNPRHYSYGGSL